MLTLSTIVVPTDFSTISRQALEFTVDLAVKFSASLKIIHVIDPSLQLSDLMWVGVDQRAFDENHVDTVRRNLQAAVDELPSDLSAETDILTGNVSNEIVLYAQKNRADLIVMATHGRTGLSHTLMGSVAEVVVRHARNPVLTLKPPIPDQNADASRRSQDPTTEGAPRT